MANKNTPSPVVGLKFYRLFIYERSDGTVFNGKALSEITRIDEHQIHFKGLEIIVDEKTGSKFGHSGIISTKFWSTKDNDRVEFITGE